MRGLTARAALLFVALAITPAAPSGQPSGTGTIVGHVKLTTRIRGTPLPSNTYQPRAINRHDPGTVPEIKNVVRLSTDFTLRASTMNRKPYTRSTWDQQFGMQVVWAHRWW